MQPPDDNTYKETHSMGPLYAVLIAALLALYAVVGVGAIVKGETTIAALMSALFLLIVLALLNFWRLTFAITESEISFGFGLIVKRFPRESLISCEPYELTFRNYLGYGIRSGLDRTVAYNTRNGQGVKLEFEGARKPYVISVDEPAYICQLLEAKPAG